MRPIYKLFSLILFTLTATIGLLCADFNSERLSSGNFVYFCKSDVSAVRGHPRSLILVPIKSKYVTSY